MSAQDLIQCFVDYGPVAIFVIVLLEYLNLPGFPAGVIMPLAGVWAAKGNMTFTFTIVITVLAGLTGSIVLYGLGRIGGGFLMEKYYKRFPKQKPLIEQKIQYLNEKGAIGIFASKLIPVARTLISIPAGVIKMNFVSYCISSACGVAIWNLLFVGAGYLFGDAVFTMLN